MQFPFCLRTDECEVALRGDQACPVSDHGIEPIACAATFHRFAPCQRDRQSVFSKAHEAEAEVGLHALSSDTQWDESSSYDVRQRGAHKDVNDGNPHHQAGYSCVGAPKRNGQVRGQGPEHPGEGKKGDYRCEQ